MIVVRYSLQDIFNETHQTKEIKSKQKKKKDFEGD